MVNSFLSGVGDIFVAMLSQVDKIWSLYVGATVISAFFALWVIREVLIYFDIIKR